jgi:hypothetical protein
MTEALSGAFSPPLDAVDSGPKKGLVPDMFPLSETPRVVSSFPSILSPPYRFSVVEDGVYRGGHPTLKNYRFLRRLVWVYFRFRLRVLQVVTD